MTITVIAEPYNAYITPRYTFNEWAEKLDSAIRASGITRTQLEGFGIYTRISKVWQNVNTNPASPSFTIPICVKTGDFMLTTVVVPGGVTVTTPSGWTLLRTDTATGGTGPVVQYIFYRFAVGTTGQLSTDGGTTVTFTVSAIANNTSAGLAVYGGVSQSSPINVQAVNSSTVNGTTMTAPSITTTVPNTFNVTCWGAQGAFAAIQYPITLSAGSKRRVDGGALGNNNSVLQICVAITDIYQVAAGASTQPTLTLLSTASWVAVQIALTPDLTLFVPTATPSASGGTLGAGTKTYRVTAFNAQGETLPCAEVQATTAGSTASVTLNWVQVKNALGYKIYGRTAGSEQFLIAISGGAVTSWTDTGSLTPSGTMPTADTTIDVGMIEWGVGVVAPGGLGTAYRSQFGGINASIPTAGYMMYQFTDTLQPTAPVFIRFDFTGFPTQPQGPAMIGQIGTATDGQGNITSNTSFPYSFSVPNISTFDHASMFSGGTWANTTNAPIYVDSDGGSSLLIAGWVSPPGSSSPTTAGTCTLIERTRNWDGTPNSFGVDCIWNSTSGSLVMIQAAALFPGYQQPNLGQYSSNILHVNSAPFVGSGILGANEYVSPVIPVGIPAFNAPSKHLVLVPSGDLGANVSFTVNIYGVNHTFLRTNSTMGTNLSLCARIA